MEGLQRQQGTLNGNITSTTFTNFFISSSFFPFVFSRLFLVPAPELELVEVFLEDRCVSVVACEVATDGAEELSD